jgi:phosphoribosyl 1,2-cyclic phosphodiesterase/CheY-like chemotaxis protein
MKTVLVIDDDRVFRALVNRFFTSQGWRILEAQDGETGIDLAVQQRPELVVCDLLMPRCNGYQVIRALQGQRASLPKTRIVVASASSFRMDRQIALEAGADDYLVKPVNQSDLVKLIERSTGSSVSAADLPERTDFVSRRTTLRFWGVRGSIPTPGPSTVVYGGNTSCVEFRGDGELIILDAGTGIRPLGAQLASEFKGRPLDLTLLISHTHWDHIQGFPFFAPSYNPKNQIRVLAYEGAQRGLEATLASQMESPYFPISMQEMPGNITVHELKDMSFQLGKVRIEATFLNHPGVCAGYRLYSSDGSIAYLPDHEPFQRFKAHVAGKNGADGEQTQLFAKQCDEKLIEFIRGADVVVLDSQYEEHEYSQHVGWGHSCVDDSVALAASAQVKRLILFHHDPNHDDAQIARMVSRAQGLADQLGSKMQVDAAREGLEISIGCDK